MASLFESVAAFAPAVGTALGGPLGGLAGKFVADYFGVGQEKVLDVINSNDPEIQQKKLDLDHAFRMHLLDLGIQEEAIHQADRASAREREKAIGGWSNPVLAAIVVIGFMGCSVAVLGGYVSGMDNPSTSNLIMALLGNLAACVNLVLSYYFGSSKGHDDSLLRGAK